LDTGQQVHALVKFVQIPQQFASSSGQHTDGSQKVGLLSKTNLDNKLVFFGPLSVIKDTKPYRPKTIINFSFT
jgi:hypothetical protein